MVTHSDMFIKCGLVNIQSVNNKTFEIYELVKDGKFDILAITETWLSDYDSAVIAEMTPETHTFVHTTRQHGRGGGVGVFVSNAFRKIKKCFVARQQSFELMQVQCEMSGKQITLIVIYRPPQTSMTCFLHELQLYLESVDMVSTELIVCGDFNVWVEDPSVRYVTEFVELMLSFNLTNLVLQPTSVRGHTIDLVFVDKDSYFFYNVHVDDTCTISPVHKLIDFRMKLCIERKQKRRIKFRYKKNMNVDVLLHLICDGISSQRIALCPHGFDRKDKCATCFAILFNEVAKSQYDDMCPILEKEIVVVDSAPWYNGVIDRVKKEKKRKERQWRRKRTDSSRREYIHARNYEKKIIIARKREYYQNLTTKAANNTNKLYRVLDSLTGKRRGKVLPDGYSDTELANKFVGFFDGKIHGIIASFNDSSTNDFATQLPTPIKSLTAFQPVTRGVLKRILSKTKRTYCASDPLPFDEIIHACDIDLLISIMCDLVNICLATCTFPDIEKRAIVKPIVKSKLDPQSLCSFRPVSNLSFMSKVMEKVILEQLLDHLQYTDAFPDNQSAYRQFYSTETALCSMVNDMHEMLDSGKGGVLVLLDLSAAFDTVVHDTLLFDCERLGIKGDALEYLRSYLEHRTYCVQIGDCFSEIKNVVRGVPQGSVLGPILFCIYTVGLSHILFSHGVQFKLFADDTQMYFVLNSISEAEERISAVMSEVGRWMECKQLKLNQAKTECLVVGRHVDRLQVNGMDLMVSKSVKNLGVVLDYDMSFKTQIVRMVRVINYHLKNISFVRKYLSDDQILLLIHNHVISRIDYCNSLFYGISNYLLKKLQVLINRSVRIVKGLSRRERITPHLIDLHWLPIKGRIEFKRCVLVYQALKFGKPKYIRDLLCRFHSDANVVLRHANDECRLEEPRFSTEVGRNAFSRSAPRLYNKLPSSIKSSENIGIFKKRLKTYLFRKCYNLNSKEIMEAYRC